MFRSLRNRLILSHIIPVLLIIPLMGAAMVYVLETRLLLPMVYQNLIKDSMLLSEITRNQPVIWKNSQIAQALVNGVSPYLSGRVSFVTLDGQLLSSSGSSGGDLGTQILDLPDLSNVSQGEFVQLKRGALAEVFAPVYDLNSQQIGIIRMTTQVLTVSEEIYQLRYLLGGILLLGVLAGVGLGSYFAFAINRPVQQVTGSIRAMADGNWKTHVDEQGPNELRELANEVNTLVDRLDNLEQSRKQLLANLVHELGRPLGAMRSAVQALLKGADKDQRLAAELMNGLDSETARLQRLLDDLSGLHGQFFGQYQLNLEEVMLNDWLATTLSPWAAAAKLKGIAWEEEIPTDLPVIVMDPDRMAQATGNLLSNAVKFTPGGKCVAVTVQVAEDNLCIQVADSGPGIPVEEQEKIFQPFYRAPQGRRIVQGMGLGLSIARDIVIAHGGKIELSSEPGSGSRFTIRLPARYP
jgi:two-component system, OmpR family, sensor histidine kinase BaeS